MRAGVWTTWLLVVLLGWGVSACTQGGESNGRRPNLILISIDTLRADRLGCYGYERPTSPALDALAERGVRFSNVIAESGWTLPSTMTLFTGLPPAVHGVVRPRKSLPESIPTLSFCTPTTSTAPTILRRRSRRDSARVPMSITSRPSTAAATVARRHTTSSI